ncbi:MAG TPA: RNA polymerase sigma factor [Steroidobacteraceae bacterium]|nr:RNA polymerase sigma factor [Steroidobacteraceae bacterium]
MLTPLKAWIQTDSFHAVLSERRVRWYNACLRITRDADLAADAVQEALLKAWDRRDEFRGESDLDTWIHRIALNAAIDLMRRRKPQAADEVDAEPLAAAPSTRGRGSDPTRQYRS